MTREFSHIDVVVRMSALLNLRSGSRRRSGILVALRNCIVEFNNDIEQHRNGRAQKI